MYNDWGSDRAAIKTIKIFFFNNLLIFQSLDSTSIPKSIFNKRFFIRSNVEHKRFSHNARKQEREREREGDLHENHFWWHRTSAQEHLHLSLIRLVPRPSSDRLCLPYTILSRKMNRSARRVEAAAPRRPDHVSSFFHGRIVGHLHRSTCPTRDIRETQSPLSAFVAARSVNQRLDDEIWEKVG